MNKLFVTALFLTAALSGPASAQIMQVIPAPSTATVEELMLSTSSLFQPPQKAAKPGLPIIVPYSLKDQAKQKGAYWSNDSYSFMTKSAAVAKEFQSYGLIQPALYETVVPIIDKLFTINNAIYKQGVQDPYKRYAFHASNLNAIISRGFHGCGAQPPSHAAAAPRPATPPPRPAIT